MRRSCLNARVPSSSLPITLATKVRISGAISWAPIARDPGRRPSRPGSQLSRRSAVRPADHTSQDRAAPAPDCQIAAVPHPLRGDH